MGSVYRRKNFVCTNCGKRLFRKADRAACKAAGHKIQRKILPTWWVSFKAKDGWHDESSHSTDKIDAQRLLREREGAADRGHTGGPYPFEDAAEAVVTDYKRRKLRSLDKTQLRITKHLTPFFGGRMMSDISTVVINDYVAKRQAETWVVQKARTIEQEDGTEKKVPEIRRHASDGSINRELQILKRIFRLAMRQQKIFFVPHIPMLKEANPRQGFFTPEEFDSIRDHLPAHLRGAFTFLYLTGWRIDTEVLALEWRRVDFASEQVKLERGTTKSGEPRTFHFTADLRGALKAQRKLTQRLDSPFVFCYLDGPRAGRRIPYGTWIKAFGKAREAAGVEASRIPHDARRTVVQVLDRAGVPRSVAMGMVGHRTEAIYQRYGIVSAAMYREAAEKVDRFATAAQRRPTKRPTTMRKVAKFPRRKSA